jgi:hypothetical protein
MGSGTRLRYGGDPRHNAYLSNHPCYCPDPVLVHSEAHMHIIMNSGREARLKLVAADHYPTLPVSRWTSAGPLAQLVAEWNSREHPEEAISDRPLLDADFEFRGGQLPS